jgi:hypothetical protein
MQDGNSIRGEWIGIARREKFAFDETGAGGLFVPQRLDGVEVGLGFLSGFLQKPFDFRPQGRNLFLNDRPNNAQVDPKYSWISLSRILPFSSKRHWRFSLDAFGNPLGASPSTSRLRTTH